MLICEFCGYEKEDAVQRPVRFQDTDGDPDTTTDCVICDRCTERQTDENGVLWAAPCEQCEKYRCTVDSYVETYAQTWGQPAEGYLLCSSCKGPDECDLF